MGISEGLPTAAQLSTRDAALAFARAGIPVFPCVEGGKRPLTPTGFHDASCDVDQVRAWWARWPGANIGMPTGSESGIDVVDIDARNTETGYAAFERASAAGLVDGELARVHTPSGGMHVYFHAIAARPQRCWQAAAALVDFRGNGGYVILPPSTLMTANGRVGYRYSLSAGGTKPVDAVALRNFIDPRPPRAGSGSVVSTSPEPTRLALWVSKLHEGERNRGLFWAACRLTEAGFAPAAIEASLALAAQTAGLTEREISATIRSASRKASAGSPSRPASHWSDRPAPGSRSGDAQCLS